MSETTAVKRKRPYQSFSGKAAIVERDGSRWEAAQNMTPAEIAATVKLWREKWGLDVRSA